MSRIGIMGGTFNPIHTGHLLLAEHVLEMVGLDQVWLIPTGCSYLKRKEGITVLSAEDRYRMVNLAIADNDRFRCLDMEIRRPGNSYSYETMEQLQKEYPEDRFFFYLWSGLSVYHRILEMCGPSVCRMYSSCRCTGRC